MFPNFSRSVTKRSSVEGNQTERNDKGIKAIYVENDKLLGKLGEFFRWEGEGRGVWYAHFRFLYLLLFYTCYCFIIVTVLDDFN